MAYDEDLADRIRLLMGTPADLSEMKMFGGLAFLINGNMAVSASGQGGLMVRMDPEASEALVDGTNVWTKEMRGRLMPGWLGVASEAVAEDGELEAWISRGVSYARSLPPKKKK